MCLINTISFPLSLLAPAPSLFTARSRYFSVYVQIISTEITKLRNILTRERREKRFRFHFSFELNCSSLWLHDDDDDCSYSVLFVYAYILLVLSTTVFFGLTNFIEKKKRKRSSFIVFLIYIAQQRVCMRKTGLKK